MLLSLQREVQRSDGTAVNCSMPEPLGRFPVKLCLLSARQMIYNEKGLHNFTIEEYNDQ